MASKPPSFPGKLGKPRKHNPYYQIGNTKSSTGQIDTSPSLKNLAEILAQSAIEEESKINTEMLLLLLKHYKIDPKAENKWLQLSYNLAIDTVPAFSYEKANRGRPKKWTLNNKLTLILAVDDYLLEHSGHSAMDACGYLAKKNTFQITNPASLYTRYMEAKQLKRPQHNYE